MTFASYTGALTTDLERVRFHIGDTVSGSGPKPADANFTDEEIGGLLTLEGSWERAVAACFEVLAGMWARHVTFNADGMSANQSDIAGQYRQSAATWRADFGTSSGSWSSDAVIRVDGYSDDIDNMTIEDV